MWGWSGRVTVEMMGTDSGVTSRIQRNWSRKRKLENLNFVLPEPQQDGGCCVGGSHLRHGVRRAAAQQVASDQDPKDGEARKSEHTEEAIKSAEAAVTVDESNYPGVEETDNTTAGKAHGIDEDDLDIETMCTLTK